MQIPHAKLIIPLCVILEKRNLSEAAEILSLSKSAVSKILQKSREAFKDPLLERQGNIMLMTPYAQEVLPKLQKLRTAASECFPDDRPESLPHQVFTVFMSCDWVHALGDGVVQILRSDLPHLSFRVSNLPDDFQEQLSDGHADIALYIHSDFQYPFKPTQLLTATPGVFVPSSIELAGEKLQFSDMQSYPLVLPDVPIKGEKYRSILKLLDVEKLETGIALRSDNMGLLFRYALENKALVVATPTLINDPWVKENFTLVKAPEPVSDVFKLMKISLITHEKTAQSPLHKRVTELLSQFIQEKFTSLPANFKQI